MVSTAWVLAYVNNFGAFQPSALIEKLSNPSLMLRFGFETACVVGEAIEANGVIATLAPAASWAFKKLLREIFLSFFTKIGD